jgi:hypothetical protein
MTDTALIYTITAYGTRTNTKYEELVKEVGKIHSDDLYQQIKRMVKEEKIEVVGDRVFVKIKSK